MDFIKELLGFAQSLNVTEIVTAILAILGGFSVLAKLTPSDHDDKLIAAIFKFINTLGLAKEKK